MPRAINMEDQNSPRNNPQILSVVATGAGSRYTGLLPLGSGGFQAPQQIATITGHSLKTVDRILERYLARTRGLAEQAIFNFENSPRTKFATSGKTGTSAPSEAKGKTNSG
jgi:hypothetical protein